MAGSGVQAAAKSRGVPAQSWRASDASAWRLLPRQRMHNTAYELRFDGASRVLRPRLDATRPTPLISGCLPPTTASSGSIVSKRKGSPYRSGRSPDWLKMKNPNAPAVKREAEEKIGVVKRLNSIPKSDIQRCSTISVIFENVARRDIDPSRCPRSQTYRFGVTCRPNAFVG